MRLFCCGSKAPTPGNTQVDLSQFPRVSISFVAREILPLARCSRLFGAQIVETLQKQKMKYDDVLSIARRLHQTHKFETDKDVMDAVNDCKEKSHLVKRFLLFEFPGAYASKLADAIIAIRAPTSTERQPSPRTADYSKFVCTRASTPCYLMINPGNSNRAA